MSERVFMRFVGILGAVLVLCVQVGAAQSGAVKVEVRQEGGRYQFYRGGRPYEVRGAVLYWRGGDTKLVDEFVACGGNSIRRSGRDIGAILNEAHKRGITVAVNLPFNGEFTRGFDYNDNEAVRRQHERVVEIVREYKNHPAVLTWNMGNEWSYRHTNKKVFEALDAAVKAVKAIDANHPVLTVCGDNPFDKEFFDELKAKVPDLDLLGVNVYGGLLTLSERIRECGWEKPYCIMEWGPTGYWQVEDTEWDSAIEETSTEKADIYQKRYEEGIKADPRCVGSYVFYWGQRQEHTHTWFNMFMETGERTEAVNVMQYEWTGEWPANRAPRIDGLRIDGKAAIENIYLKPGTSHEAKVAVSEPDGDAMRIEWELIAEPKKFGDYAGRGEKRGEAIEGLIEREDGDSITFRAPEKEGVYRVFVCVYDGKGNAGTANVPFKVQP